LTIQASGQATPAERSHLTQARQVFDNLRAALQAVGAGFEQVVKLTYYLVDASQLPIVREVRDQYVNIQQPPASTAVEVRRLVRDDLLLEVEAIAVIASFQPIISSA
jgi:enamine deaminase RidA (YjgF/YER057c/UK114 family)